MGLEARETGSSQEGQQLSQFGGVTIYHLRVHTLWQAATYLEEPQHYKRLLRQVATTSIGRTRTEARAIVKAKGAIGAQHIVARSLQEWQTLEEAAGIVGCVLVDSEDEKTTLERKSGSGELGRHE